MRWWQWSHMDRGATLPFWGAPAHQPACRAPQVQALKLGCRDEQGGEGKCLTGSSAQTGQRGQVLGQGGHRVAFKGHIYSKQGCAKEREDSQPLLGKNPAKPAGCLGVTLLWEMAAGVGEDGRQAAREQACVSMHIDKEQTSKSIFKSEPDLECLRTAIQVKPVRAGPRISRKSRFRSMLNLCEDTVHIYTQIPS